MADNRIHSSIAERLDILFNARPDHWRRWRRIACWLGGIMPLALLGWSALPGNQTVYQSGSVATVHRGIGDNCRACHIQAFQPFCMLIGTAADKRQIERQACGKCHPHEMTLDHNRLFDQESIAERAVDCFDCHQEHQNADQLLAVADAHCVSCHGNTHDLVAHPGSLNFHGSITSFTKHPEFAVVDPERNLDGSSHQAAQLVDSSGHQDKSPFHFDHAAHLNHHGSLLPHSHPEYADEKQRKLLRCSDCHVPDTSGAYMRPISYEQHCADCHPLVFSTKLAQPRNVEPELDPPWALPHGSEEALHGVIRDRLIAFARSKGAAVDTDTSQPRRPQLPNKRRAAPAPSKSEYEFAERELNGIRWGDEVVQESLGATGRVVRQGCEFCHQIEASSDFDPIRDFPWKVKRNFAGGIIPDRWMPHSKFRHDRHNSFGGDVLNSLLAGIDFTIDVEAASSREIRDAHCLVCHQEAISSDSAKSVLMPSIQVCHDCHGSADRTIGFARADCVECHDYHHATDSK